ncbi:MAG: helicase-related protein [Candidatus Woesearchaeota archaeon]
MKKKSPPKILHIAEEVNDETTNIVLDTLHLGKQIIVFVNSKKSAESVAEKISVLLKKRDLIQNAESLHPISESILSALDTPTKQCRRLAMIVQSGVAFHHSGLVSKQRNVIEEEFRNHNIKVIVGTTTLAVGVDLPAYRVVIRDLKRFTRWGMQYIPVLEYSQMSGRAGRPSFDDHGEAIMIADSPVQKAELKDRYISGVPEEIVSKLAVEPIMRTYILSLIASEFVRTTYDLESFFEQTFYAHEYGDMNKLRLIIRKMLEQLAEWKFILIEQKDDPSQEGSGKDFVSALRYAFAHDASIEKKVVATPLGRRVSELYLDPYTANYLIASLQIAFFAQTRSDSEKKDSEKNVTVLSYLHVMCSCLELYPLLRVKTREIDGIIEFINTHEEEFLPEIAEPFTDEHDEFLASVKTTQFFLSWLDEKDEEFLLEQFNVTPGELNSKRDLIDWLCYSSEELAKLAKMHSLVKDIAKLRFRLKYGVREELIALLQLKGIGRIRARKMFNSRIHDISDVKKVDLTTLSQLIGKAIALDIKKQVGQDLSTEKVEVKENKRKGQINLKDYGE